MIRKAKSWNHVDQRHAIQKSNQQTLNQLYGRHIHNLIDFDSDPDDVEGLRYELGYDAGWHGVGMNADASDSFRMGYEDAQGDRVDLGGPTLKQRLDRHAGIPARRGPG